MKKKIGILIESDFYEKEIMYYNEKFPQAGFETVFLSRLWGFDKLEFKGHETQMPFECSKSLENMPDEEIDTFSAVIIPSGYVSDRLRYTEDINRISPASEFIKRAFANRNIFKCIICHGLWLISPTREVIKGRMVTCHNNLIWDVRAYGAEYTDEDLVIDDDLITARTGDHCEIFAEKIIYILNKR
jgi:protease I